MENKKINSNGYITLTIIIMVFIVSSMLLLLFFQPILNTTKNVANSSKLSQKITDDMNSKERLYSKIRKNISFVGELDYQDLGKKYVITTIDEDFEHKEEHFSPHKLNSFNLENESSIYVDVSVRQIDEELPYSYDVELNINGKDLLDGQGENLDKNIEIYVPANKVYNRETDETNYGEYRLNIHSDNCQVNAIVTYDKLYYRKAKVTNENFNANIIIDNKNKTKIKMERGD